MLKHGSKHVQSISAKDAIHLLVILGIERKTVTLVFLLLTIILGPVDALAIGVISTFSVVDSRDGKGIFFVEDIASGCPTPSDAAHD